MQGSSPSSPSLIFESLVPELIVIETWSHETNKIWCLKVNAFRMVKRRRRRQIPLEEVVNRIDADEDEVEDADIRTEVM